MKNEIWKSVDVGGFFEGFYEISDLGRWKILPRRVQSSKGERWHISKPRITTGTNSHGYRVVQMKREGIKKQVGVHVVVALAFINNHNNLPEVNRKDLIRSNNNKDNLEWVTGLQNKQHARDNGACWTTRGTERANSKLTDEKVKEIRRLYMTGKHSYRSLAKDFDVSFSHIDDIVNYRRWKHIK